MKTQFDTEFAAIPTLKWLPWVGSNYAAVPISNKTLIIGESHYYEPAEGQHSFDKHQDNTFTRTAIQKIAVEREYKTYSNGAAKVFPNFHRTIFTNDTFDTRLLWENVCFYNFIQDPMNTKHGRPKEGDYRKGWTTFSEVLNILQPSMCLFLGNSCASFLPQSFTHDTVVKHGLSDDGWLNRIASRKAMLQLSNGQEVKLKFIKHPSRFYSWKQWSAHLKEKHGNMINWLTSSTTI
jgi:hypothetical protein